MLHHVCEKVFLPPTREHPTGNERRVQALCSGDDRALMPARREAAHLRHRDAGLARAERGLSHGQLHTRTAAAGGEHLLFDKFALRPDVPDVLAIGQRADALVPELTQQTVRGPLCVEHDDEPVQLWIVVQLTRLCHFPADFLSLPTASPCQHWILVRQQTQR